MALDAVIRSRLTKEDKAKLEAEAKRRHLSLSDLLRVQAGLEPLATIEAKRKDLEARQDASEDMRDDA